MGIKRWILPAQDEQQVCGLSAQTGLPTLVCAVLCQRGYTDTQQVLEIVSGEGFLDDPFLLADMEQAVARIGIALEQQERIAVFGDYDCDGMTATALLTSYLQSAGGDVFYYIPSREREGYGLNREAVDFIHEEHATLIITVDNGVSAHDEIAYAKTLGIDVVVTDHHTPRATLPDAVAVVNPHRADCPSKFKHLAGVGVAFKLICALEGGEGEELLEHYSDLVMLGTVADVVSLTGENRTIVRHGLERIQDTERPGLRALLQVSGLEGVNLSSESAAFGLIPRLNAAGRMDCVDDAVELLLTDDIPYAGELAAGIHTRNEERKALEAEVMEQIEGILSENPQILSERLLILSGEGWHHGVVGIVASKVQERYGKPTILFCLDGDEARGSGRSLEGFSLIEAIMACSEHLTRYGGHTLAAGLTLPRAWLDDFIHQILDYAAKTHPVMPIPVCEVDYILHPQELVPEMLEPLELLEPFGQGNRPPLFLLEDLTIEGIYPTADKKHIRIRLHQERQSFYAVFFRMQESEFPYHVGDRVDLVAAVGVNEYNGKQQVSVKIRDLRCAGVPQEDILQQRGWYAAFLAGEEAYPYAELYPERDDLASVYRYLRSCKEYPFGEMELYYRLLPSGIRYAKMRVALDVLEEMGLITREPVDGRASIRLIPAAGKVDMTQSKILTSLKV